MLRAPPSWIQHVFGVVFLHQDMVFLHHQARTSGVPRARVGKTRRQCLLCCPTLRGRLSRCSFSDVCMVYFARSLVLGTFSCLEEFACRLRMFVDGPRGDLVSPGTGLSKSYSLQWRPTRGFHCSPNMQNLDSFTAFKQEGSKMDRLNHPLSDFFFCSSPPPYQRAKRVKKWR